FSLQRMRLLALLVLFISLNVGSTSLCGLRKNSKFNGARFRRHIIGGNKVANVGDWPWQVAVQVFNSTLSSICGGTVIADRWILTAAHCANKQCREGFTYRIAAGTLKALVVDTSEQVVFINVTRFYVHPEYESGAISESYMHNDIMLLELESALTFNEIVSPVCLPSRVQTIPQDKIAVAIGYGQYEQPSFTNPVPSDGRLRETKISIIPRDACKTRLDAVNPKRIKFNITEAHICAGSAGHGVFHGDSGGPLMMRAKDGRWFQFGIVSAGVDELILAQDLAPAIFANVVKFCNWIEETTMGEAKCEKEEVDF
ncbi:hypothetical protein PFISCL1PPCAC_27730, partial [Pristionchus fissidentatus]